MKALTVLVIFVKALTVLDELRRFAGDRPCILAGDFNAAPDSPLYTMMTTGHASEDSVDHLLNSTVYEDTQRVIGDEVGLCFHINRVFLLLTPFYKLGINFLRLTIGVPRVIF